MEAVEHFLEKNGFIKVEENSYANDMCGVVIEEDHYAISNNDGDTMYSPNLNIYWLIGVLTYLGYMNKNYNQ